MEVEFVVEDGTGKSDATSYISEDDMKQYWYNVGYAYDTYSSDSIKRYLNKACIVIDSKYLRKWPGFRAHDDQNMEWLDTLHNTLMR